MPNNVAGHVPCSLEVKTAARTFQGNEDRFRQLLDLLPDAVIVHIEGRIVYANAACVRLLAAQSSEQLVSRKVWTILHPDDHQVVAGRIRVHFETGQTLPPMEHTMVALDGTLVPVEAAAVPCEWDGAPAIEVVLRDIRDRRRAQEAVEQWQKSLELAQNSGLRIGLWDWDLATNRVIFSDESCRQFGYKPGELSSVDQALARIHPEDRTRVEEEVRAVLTGATQYSSQYRVIHPDGFICWIDARGVLLRNQSTRMIGIAVDVSSSKAAQSILQESEKNFRSIVEQAPHGIYRADAQGKLLLVNPAFVKMLGYDSKEEVLALNIGKDVYRYPEQRADLVAQALQNGRFSDIEIEMRCKNGSAIIVRANGLPVYDQRGELEAFQVIVEDVTKSKTLERQFWQAQKLEAVGRLAGGVAHDFNNTLMIVSSYADLILQRDCGDSKTLSYAEQIHRAALKASSVTQQLLAFSRKQILEPEVLDTDTVLKDLGKMLPKLLGEDITLVIEPHSTGCHVKADRGQLEQIIMNLVVNARDAMPSGGRLLIRSQGIEVDSAFAAEHPPTVPGRYVLLTVTDTGLGMDTETRARIFEPFFTTKERGKGTGLGLATVYGIVKQSGGFIWVTSEPGAGTTFDIYLPQVPDALTPAAKPYGAKNSVRGSENILLVEDEVALLEATREFLEFSGYSVISANSGAEALRAAQEQDGNIDLLVTDVVMPELDGVELASCLRAKFPALKVLYMSGYADRALQDNLDRKMLLRKPFSQELLAVKIREALSSRTETKS